MTVAALAGLALVLALLQLPVLPPLGLASASLAVLVGIAVLVPLVRGCRLSGLVQPGGWGRSGGSRRAGARGGRGTLDAAADSCSGESGHALTNWRMLVVLLSLLALHTLWVSQRWYTGVLPAVCERESLQLAGRVDGLVEHRSGAGDSTYARFRLRVEDLGPGRCAGPRRVLLYWSDAPQLRPGDMLHLEVLLRVPWGMRNPYSRGAQSNHVAQGLQAIGSVRGGRVTRTPASPLSSDALHRHRDRLAARLRQAAGPRAGPLLAALLIGDRRGLDDVHWARMRVFGLTHLFVISGMHVSLLAFAGWIAGSALGRLGALGRRGQRRLLLPPVLALCAAVMYALLAGWGLPARRALLMLLPALLLLHLGRTGSGWRALLLAALLLVAVQPLAALGASLWLSAGAVAMLLWLGAWVRRQRALAGAFSLHGFMVLAMLPLSLFFFDAAATAGALVNLVAVPLVTLWTLPMGLLGLVLSTVALPLDELCWSLAAGPLLLFWDGLGYWETTVSSHSLVRGRPPVPVLAALVLAVLALPLPGRFRAGCLAGMLSLPTLGPVAPGDGGVEVLVFDVGQGTAVLVRDGEHALLYDTGGGVPGGSSRAQAVILPYLHALGIRRLELLVISHLDADHSAGLDTVRAALAVDETWSGAGAVPGSRPCRIGGARRLGSRVTVRSLSAAFPRDDDNDGSCVLLVEADGARLLLPGDIGRARERDLVAWWGGALAAEALVLGHHGSATSSSELWLRHVRPSDAIVTAARANRFGHPAPGVVEALQRRGIRGWSTADHGALRLTPHPGGWRIQPHRHRGRPFWWLRSPRAG